MPYLHALMINRKKKLLALGDLIAADFIACGGQKAERIVRPAVHTRRVEFRGARLLCDS